MTARFQDSGAGAASKRVLRGSKRVGFGVSVQGLGLRVQGLAMFRVEGSLGIRVIVGFRVFRLGFWGLGFRVRDR